jgi:hypothetical protein
MKVSELIEGLKNMMEVYGDLPVSATLALPDGAEPNVIVSDDNLTLSYNQFKDDEDRVVDEIGIQNFPY